MSYSVLYHNVPPMFMKQGVQYIFGAHVGNAKVSFPKPQRSHSEITIFLRAPYSTQRQS